MTLFVAEGFIRAVQRYENRGMCNPAGVIQRALERWWVTQTGEFSLLDELSGGGYLIAERRLQVQRAPGATNLRALEEWMRSERAARNRSKGCGAVMRSVPIGLGAVSSDTAFDLARESGGDTHGRPSG